MCSEGAKRQYLANGNTGSIGGDGDTCHGLLGLEEADLTRHVCVCVFVSNLARCELCTATHLAVPFGVVNDDNTASRVGDIPSGWVHCQSRVVEGSQAQDALKLKLEEGQGASSSGAGST